MTRTAKRQRMMLIACSAQGTTLDAQIDQRLGRAQQFLLVDSDSLACEVIANPNGNASGGAGIQAAQLLASKGAQAVITGNCGPNAFAAFQAAGIPVYTGASGTIREALAQYQRGELTAAAQPNVGGHFGDGRKAA